MGLSTECETHFSIKTPKGFGVPKAELLSTLKACLQGFIEIEMIDV